MGCSVIPPFEATGHRVDCGLVYAFDIDDPDHLEVVGHLSMAQDQPPRARVRTTEHTYLATVGDELLVRIRELLFSEVRATIAIGMSTSPTSGTPETHVELIDVDAA